MRAEEIKIYEFSELSKEAQDRFIGNNTDWFTDLDWWDYIYDDMTAIGKIIGIDIDKINFSGFWSQGDGASFTGNYSYATGWKEKLKAYCPKYEEIFEIGERLQELQKDYFYKISATISRNHSRYVHENSVDIDIDEDEQEYKDFDKIERELSGILKAFMREIYSRLEKAYGEITSDEYLREYFIEDDVYEFTVDGELYN